MVATTTVLDARLYTTLSASLSSELLVPQKHINGSTHAIQDNHAVVPMPTAADSTRTHLLSLPTEILLLIVRHFLPDDIHVVYERARPKSQLFSAMAFASYRKSKNTGNVTSPPESLTTIAEPPHLYWKPPSVPDLLLISRRFSSVLVPVLYQRMKIEVIGPGGDTCRWRYWPRDCGTWIELMEEAQGYLREWLERFVGEIGIVPMALEVGGEGQSGRERSSVTEEDREV
ncbi:uncharacterized protein AB675_7720 [Cyphellophora attinorum]|uniref:Uncharacterized protein n=1 Tax=Cyphellophora attinorum TaxID=1664694 RepID=A0A0N1H9S8_9EURO|nr:uncharacterized protein AB675_7720 [Phialophora attinorum]KPI40505.1 hypothetical protein AB675_7720 [Phialophora attinorum]